MVRLSRMTDYGIVLLTHVVVRADREVHNARDLATETRIPRPSVSKILKALAREGQLVSRRGVRGGYSLARPPEEISVADIICALEGPIAMTDCNMDEQGGCTLVTLCPTRAPWQMINQAVRGALEKITLAEMAKPVGLATPGGPAAGKGPG